MIMMAVDLGRARTGLSVCDEAELLASPAGVIHQKEESKLIQEIVKQAERFGAKRFIIGLPRNMDGSEGERARECRRIGEKLRQVSGLETMMWDERCTTLAAHQVLNSVNVRGKKRKAVVDAVAACMILEDYLRFKNKN